MENNRLYAGDVNVQRYGVAGLVDGLQKDGLAASFRVAQLGFHQQSGVYPLLDDGGDSGLVQPCEAANIRPADWIAP